LIYELEGKGWPLWKWNLFKKYRDKIPYPYNYWYQRAWSWWCLLWFADKFKLINGQCFKKNKDKEKRKRLYGP